MPSGIITKSLSGFYFVEYNGIVFKCKARGILKKNNITPLVGDYVTFSLINQSEGIIEDVCKRKNQLLRPPIANVDQVFLTFSIVEPELNLSLLDRLLIYFETKNVTTKIIITKNDLLNKQDIIKILDYYQQIGYFVFYSDKNISEERLAELKTHLSGKVTVLVGQSGVGKSTLINKIAPNSKQETGELSQKLGRGKHTTRIVELLHLEKKGFIADAPGFSQLSLEEIETTQLSSLFIEFNKYSLECKFKGCLHDKEKGCMVKQAVSEEKILESRYKNYLIFLNEIKEQKRRNYND